MDLDRLEQLGQTVEDHPDDPDGWLALAEALLDHRAAELARPIMVRARACELSTPKQWKLVAELALRLDDRPAARQALRTSFALDEDDVGAVAWFARIALEDGEAEEAVPVLKKALARKNHPDLRRWLAQAVAATRPSSIKDASSPDNPAVADDSVAVVSNNAQTNFTGDITVFSLPEMLEFLFQQRSTGTLQILSKQHSANVHMQNGRILDIEHPQRPSLLTMLSHRGHGANAQLLNLSVETMTDETALAKALIEGGIVSQTEIQDALRDRIEQGVFNVLQWPESYAQFRAGPELRPNTEGFDTHWILLAVMQRMDETKQN